jgi:hypothetical protein
MDSLEGRIPAANPAFCDQLPTYEKRYLHKTVSRDRVKYSRSCPRDRGQSKHYVAQVIDINDHDKKVTPEKSYSGKCRSLARNGVRGSWPD